MIEIAARPGTGARHMARYYADYVRLMAHFDRAAPGAVHRVIYEQLVLGIVRDESRCELREIVEGLVAEGAEGVILGCTEIELLIRQSDVELPVFPCTTLHVNAALDRALGTD